jgi:hypothetical protein
MVLLDQTQRECAREHGCPPGQNCPFDNCFCEMSGVSAEHLGELAAAKAAALAALREAVGTQGKRAVRAERENLALAA